MSRRFASPPPGSTGDRVLVVGVYLSDRPNLAAETSLTLRRSRRWRVDQRWMAAGLRLAPASLESVTCDRTAVLRPKFTLINQLLSEVLLESYRFLIVCDDDISVPDGFLDDYLDIVISRDLALSQPARTPDSHTDHAFVAQMTGLTARWTRFVEIGPLIVARFDAARLLVPFDETSPMGWGYDLVWPPLLEAAGLRLGIVDQVPVRHVLRPTAGLYDRRASEDQMTRYLSLRSHISRDEAYLIVQAYA